MEQSLPDVHPLIVAEFGVINEQFFAKHFPQAACELGGECNFRHQIERLFAGLERIFNEMHIDGGFAARGNAMQQGDWFFFKALVNGMVGALLIGTQCGRCHHLAA